MADARKIRNFDEALIRLAGSISAYELWQLPSGLAAFLDDPEAQSSGIDAPFKTFGQVNVTKATGVAFLDGGRVYWDHSANNCTYRKNSDRDFYIGRARGDFASGDAQAVVDLNLDPRYDIDIKRDPFTTAMVGTRALGGLDLLWRGGYDLTLSSTNEAQKIDILSVDGFAVTANPIVEAAFRVVSDGAGTEPDFNIGVASETHATDADTIAESAFIHLNGNSTTIYAESDDGTNETAATDTTTTYTESATAANRVEVWIDLRDMSSVKFYVNAVRVLSGTTFNMAAAAGPLYFLAHLEKTAAASTYNIVIDKGNVRFMEQ